MAVGPFFALIVIATATSAVSTNLKLLDSAAVTFNADMSGTKTTVVKQMLECFGSSHGSTTLRQDWRDALVRARQDLGIKRVRFHGIFNDDVSTYLRGHANMYNVFNTFDFLLSIGVRPIVEMSFTPVDLASDKTASLMHYDANDSPPSDLSGSWSAFIKEFASLILNRYGPDEVHSWLFEMYNEYFDMSTATALALKSVDPLLRFGGPATCQTGWIANFTAWAANASSVYGIRLADAVTTHLYPTDRMVAKTRDGFAETVAVAAAIADAAGLPLTMTEFNSGLGIGQLDLPYSSAFVLHQQLAFSSPQLSNVDTLSYWTFTDSGFEEGGLDSVPWADKYGIQTLYGVPKPVYRAFQMIKELPSAAAPVTVVIPMVSAATATASALTPTTGATSGTVDVIVASEQAGRTTSVTALVTNFDIYNSSMTPATVTIQFSGINAGSGITVNATLELIDSTHANARPVWLAAGSPTYPTNAEVYEELQASMLVPVNIPLTAGVANTYSVTFDLEPYAVGRVRFQYEQ